MVNIFITRKLSRKVSTKESITRRSPTWTQKTLQKISSDLADKLVVKLPTEHAQLASTAIRFLKNSNIKDTQTKVDEKQIYKISHKNHPQSLWASDDVNHLKFLIELGKAECKEYQKRYGREHACLKILNYLGGLLAEVHSKRGDEYWQDPPQCMPAIYKCGSVHKAYRKYIIYEKSYYSQWNKTKKPPTWYIDSFNALTKPS